MTGLLKGWPKDWPAVLFVHLVAVACCVVAGWFVRTQGSAGMPNGDEWALLYDHLATDDLPRFAVKHHNEHRYPVGKLVWVLSLRASGYDFRAAAFVSIALLTAAAVLLLWAARGARGQSLPADAVLPVLLLNLGHSTNLLMSYQVGFVVFVYGVAGWVWAAGQLTRTGGWGWAVLAGVYGSLVVQSGGFGVVFTPPLALWAVLAAGRSGWSSRVVLGAFAVAWVGYTGWVWATAPAGTATPPVRTPDTTFGTAVGFLATGFGGWPITGEAWPRWAGGAAAVAAYLIGFAAVGRGWRRDPFVIALGCVLLGVLGLAAAAAYTRGYGLAGRFVTPSAVGLAACWLAATRPLRRFTAVGSVAAVAAAGGLYWTNIDPGLRDGYYTRLVLGEMRTDLTNRVPPVFLAGRYGGTVPVLLGDQTADFLRFYRRAGVGVFAGLADDPMFAVVPVSGVAVPFGFESDSAANPASVTIPDPTGPVLGLRLLVDNRVAAGWQRVWLRWADADTGAEREVWAYPPWVENRLHLTFPVSGRPNTVRLVADGIVHPLTVEAVEWMVPK